MNIKDINRNAFAMLLTSPAFPSGPYRFVSPEFLSVTYRTTSTNLLPHLNPT